MQSANNHAKDVYQLTADDRMVSACRQFSTEAVALFTSFEKLMEPLEPRFLDAESKLENYLKSEEIVRLKNRNIDSAKSPHELPIERLTAYITLKQLRDEAFFSRIMSPRSQLLSLVAVYEGFLRRLLRLAFSQTPDVLDQVDTIIHVRDVRHCADKEAIVELGIERCIDSVLRESALQQIHRIGKLFGVDNLLERAAADVPRFAEIMERRNMIAHCDGVASPYYIAQCQRLSIKDPAAVGEPLYVSATYFQSAVECLLCAGIRIAQLVWRSSLHRTDRKEKINVADYSLRQITYWLLELERYELAVALLEFAVSLKKASKGYMARIFLINLSQAYKWMGHGERCTELLGGEDWNDADTAFQLSVAVLNDDFLASRDLMIRAGRDGLLKEEAFRNWPIYKLFRKTPEFRQAFKVLYGYEYSSI